MLGIMAIGLLVNDLQLSGPWVDSMFPLTFIRSSLII